VSIRRYPNLLYFDKSHSKPVVSAKLLYAMTRDARLWVAAGKYARIEETVH
jgi:hypothetical protein